MQLIYRGQKYTPVNATVEMIDSQVEVTYRGATYQIKRSVSSHLRPKAKFSYRGIPYKNGSEIVAVAVPAKGFAPIFN